MGSWKIIAILWPRTSSIWHSESPSRSLPSKVIEPDATWPGFCSSPMMESDVTDLPEPDSPTTASISPFSMEKVTPSTALTTPLRVGNSVTRSLTSSIAIGYRLLDLGSTASRMPSPRRLNASTVSVIARPGKTMACGAWKM